VIEGIVACSWAKYVKIKKRLNKRNLNLKAYEEAKIDFVGYGKRIKIMYLKVEKK